MDAISAIEKTARQLESGNYEHRAESPQHIKLPSNEALRTRVEAFLKGDDPSTAGLRASLRSNVEWALRALYEGVPPPEGADVGLGLEAVILADGSRPVFFITDDRLVLSGAGDGPFVDSVVKRAAAVESAARAVGRVETDDRSAPPGLDKWYDGTAFLVSDQLAMTNRHVIERMVNEPGNAEGPFTLKARYWLNFGAQAGATTARRFKIERVVFAGPQVIGHGGDITRLDMALLKIGAPQIDGTQRPTPLPLSFEPLSTSQHIAVVGYPAAPRIHTGIGTPPVDHELEEVLRRLFDARFGFKRCASGEIDAGPGFPKDTRRWTVQHDASTLSGNSGSPVMLLADGPPRVSALHFSGVPREANCAHIFSTIVTELRDAGVTVPQG